MDDQNEKILRHVILDLGPEWDGETALFEKRLLQNEISCTKASTTPETLSKEDTVFLTDSPQRAREVNAHGIPCFGCSKDGAWFENTALVLESLEGIDGSYLEEWMLRMQGLPARIGRTKRLEIREIAKEDFEGLIRIYRQQDPSYRVGEEIFTREGLAAYIRTAYRLQGFGLWSVLYRRKVIGCCGFSPAKSAIELQYMVDKAYQRQGFGTEMCLAAISYAQERLSEERIVVRILPGNEASLALAVKLDLPVV